MEDIRQNLTESERAKFESGAEALHAMQNRAFDDWWPIAEGLVALRSMVMRLLHINKPSGRYYTATLSKACKESVYAGLRESTRSNLMHCADNRSMIDKMRSEWTADDRLRIRHPDTMVKKLRAFTKAKPITEMDTEKVSPYRKLVGELEAANHTIAVLKRQADDGGNLWKANDMARDIAAFLYPHFAKMSEKKCREVLKALTERLNADWNKGKRERKSDDKGRVGRSAGGRIAGV